MAGVSNQTIDGKTRGIIQHIVDQIKSQGVFDRFRRDCLEELDSKEPYRQLKQRVESHVATFLSKQMFSSHLPKNQLRSSLRTNINQSEVLSKGVDRLLEQVLIEKSGSFYNEIESLVEEHLINTGYYTRYERDKPQKLDHVKLSDKQVEEIIKQETNKLLETNTDGRASRGGIHPLADSPPPGTCGEVTQVETVVSSSKELSLETTDLKGTNAEPTKATDIDNLNSALSHGVVIGQAGKPVPSVDTSNPDGSSCERNECASAGRVVNEPVITTDNVSDKITSSSDRKSERNSRVECCVEASRTKNKTSTCEEAPQSQNMVVLPEVKSEKGPTSTEVKESDESEKTHGRISHAREQAISEKPEFGLVNIRKTEVDQPQFVDLPKHIAEVSETKTQDSHCVSTDNFERINDVKNAAVDPGEIKGKLDHSPVNLTTEQKRGPGETKSVQSSHGTGPNQEQCANVKASKKPVSIPNAFLFSTDEETDDDAKFALSAEASSRIIPRKKAEKRNPDISALDLAELSDSDITVSSVHTSDLSSLEDSMSDMEFEDYKDLQGRKERMGAKDGKKTSASECEGVIATSSLDPGNFSKVAAQTPQQDTSEACSLGMEPDHSPTSESAISSPTSLAGSSNETGGRQEDETPHSSKAIQPSRALPTSTSSQAIVPNSEMLVTDTLPSGALQCDVADETAVEHSDGGSKERGKQKRLNRTSSEGQSTSSNDASTRHDQQETPAQRRSSRFSSKDRPKADEASPRGHNGGLAPHEENEDSSKRLRRKRKEDAKAKAREPRRSSSREESRSETVDNGAAKTTSDSTDSDIKLSKRSRRKLRPTRCYSPSDNS